MIINSVSSLTRRARDLYSDRRMAAKWVLAARNLRANNAWILDGAVPKWGCKPACGQTPHQRATQRREESLQD